VGFRRGREKGRCEKKKETTRGVSSGGLPGKKGGPLTCNDQRGEKKGAKQKGVYVGPPTEKGRLGGRKEKSAVSRGNVNLSPKKKNRKKGRCLSTERPSRFPEGYRQGKREDRQLIG